MRNKESNRARIIDAEYRKKVKWEQSQKNKEKNKRYS